VVVVELLVVLDVLVEVLLDELLVVVVDLLVELLVVVVLVEDELLMVVVDAVVLDVVCVMVVLVSVVVLVVVVVVGTRSETAMYGDHVKPSRSRHTEAPVGQAARLLPKDCTLRPHEEAAESPTTQSPYADQ